MDYILNQCEEESPYICVLILCLEFFMNLCAILAVNYVCVFCSSPQILPIEIPFTAINKKN